MSDVNDRSKQKLIKPKKNKEASPLGCVAVVLGILAFSAFAFFMCGVVPSWFMGYFVEHTAPVPGDAASFDPILHFDAIQQHAGQEVRLVEFEAYYVRSDGTLDLYADYYPRVEATFYRELTDPPADAPPIGAGGSADARWYERVTVDVYSPNQMRSVRSGSNSYTYVNLGMDRDTDTPTTYKPGEEIAKPLCSFKRLWDVALERDAPAAAVATILYDSEGYEFSIRDTDIRLKFNNECRLVN